VRPHASEALLGRGGEDPAVEDCTEPDCDAPAAVLVHVPWGADRVLCAAHARPIARKDGVVAEPLEGADDAFP